MLSVTSLVIVSRSFQGRKLEAGQDIDRNVSVCMHAQKYWVTLWLYTNIPNQVLDHRVFNLLYVTSISLICHTKKLGSKDTGMIELEKSHNSW